MSGEPLPELNVIIAVVGGMILLLGIASQRLGVSPLPPVVIALGVGILVGPKVLDLIDPAEIASRSAIIEYAARLTLAIGLFGVALRIGRRYWRQRWRDVAILVGAGMPLMWAISSGLVYWILDLPFWLALLIGAIITPTDPIASTPIVSGEVAEKSLPARLRHVISADSGANDGLAYLFVLLPILMLTRPSHEAVSHWLTKTLLWEVIAATVIGIVIGYVAAKLLQFADERDLIEGEWRLIYTVALALFTAGLGRIIATDEVLLVFAAGVVFTQLLSEEERNEEDHGQEAVNRFFSVPIFALLGTAIPWDGWIELGWPGLACAIAVIALRRPLAILVLSRFIGSVRGSGEALFVGWFGPIAVAAMYYASLAERKVHEPLIWDIVSLVICVSVVVHGMSAAPLTRLMGTSENGSSDGKQRAS